MSINPSSDQVSLLLLSHVRVWGYGFTSHLTHMHFLMDEPVLGFFCLTWLDKLQVISSYSLGVKSKHVTTPASHYLVLHQLLYDVWASLDVKGS